MLVGRTHIIQHTFNIVTLHHTQRQVVVVKIGNECQHMYMPGMVQVVFTAGQEWWLWSITVAERGRDIDPSRLEEVREVFARLFEQHISPDEQDVALFGGALERGTRSKLLHVQAMALVCTRMSDSTSSHTHATLCLSAC